MCIYSKAITVNSNILFCKKQEINLRKIVMSIIIPMLVACGGISNENNQEMFPAYRHLKAKFWILLRLKRP